jgi:TnpA family transposase
MKTEDLVEHWTLQRSERKLLANKSGPTRLGFAVLLKYFQFHARFPRQPEDVPEPIVKYLARQVGVSSSKWALYDWQGRAIKYHRPEIRTALGFRQATTQDGKGLAAWLKANVLPEDPNRDHLETAVYARCRAEQIEPPSPDQIGRLVSGAASSYEKSFCRAIFRRLPLATHAQLDALLSPENALRRDPEDQDQPERAVLHDLRQDPGKVSLNSMATEIEKIQRVRSLALPPDLFHPASTKILQTYRQRVAIEEPYEIRRHPEPLRVTMLAAYCHLRGQELTDNLVDLLISTIHHIEAKAERRVQRELLADLKRVASKKRLLFELAPAVLAHPEGSIKEVIYPVVDEQTWRDLAKEGQATGPAFREHLRAVIRNSYRSHYRRMLPRLLNSLEFRCNNEARSPVMRALELFRKYAQTKIHTYPVLEEVPLEGVVRTAWQEAVVEKDDEGNLRVNRIYYEICVLKELREKLRCKEIWVVGANRYRNPDEDLPSDYDARRVAYYEALNLPLDPDVFLAKVQQEMKAALGALNDGLPKNPYVKILPKDNGWIKLSHLEPQAEPTNLVSLKDELGRRWPQTSLLDMLKETDLRVGFTDSFRSATAWENIDRAALQQRVLRCLYGLGTNTGLKRLSGAQHGVSYKDLLYTRRRFITKEHLRNAIRQVVNATFRARLPKIWGEATTACASDSKKFGAWDQNLMTEWHVRYGGRGVMIYWHVERKSSCIYSQLKACSSSEVAAMIEGVLRHCTEMNVEKTYADSHGQSEVGFAFCRLLTFQLLPRLKAIHSQKLYRPEAGNPDAFPQLQLVLERPIDWDLIRRQYDQMVKFTTALRLGTAEPEDILRRFTRNNLQHPTYKALAELGKATKTIFLCRYLESVELRREIQEGLNVVENWNSANTFIFYGKAGEMATNRIEDQEVSMLALHLLQISLVYVNTLMIQRVMTEEKWRNRMTPEDLRALTPLLYGHVTPYGHFRLDMRTRLDIGPEVGSPS